MWGGGGFDETRVTGCDQISSKPRPPSPLLYELLLPERRRQLPAVDPAQDVPDAHDVVAVGPRAAVVVEAADGRRCPPLVGDVRVDVVHRVSELPVEDAEGDVELAVYGRADRGQPAVVTVETGDGQDVRVVRRVADGDRVARLDVAVEAAQDEAVLRVEAHVEADHLAQRLGDGRAAILAHLVECVEDVGRSLSDDHGVVAVLDDADPLAAVGRPGGPGHEHLLEFLQFRGHVDHEGTGVLGARDDLQAVAGDVQEHAVRAAVEAAGRVLVEADVGGLAVAHGAVHRGTGVLDNGWAKRDAHCASLLSLL